MKKIIFSISTQEERKYCETEENPVKIFEKKSTWKIFFSSKKKFEGEIVNREKNLLLSANDIISDWVENPNK